MIILYQTKTIIAMRVRSSMEQAKHTTVNYVSQQGMTFAAKSHVSTVSRYVWLVLCFIYLIIHVLWMI